MKKNGYFTPKAENRHILNKNHVMIKDIKSQYNLKPKTRYRLIVKLAIPQLHTQIRNSIQ